jgi:phosphosulfolactate synthase (CoM biosynthesis protein A)
MFRFCQFTELLQALLMGPAKALAALAQTIAVESLIAKNSSLKQTQAAVEAGATRVSAEVRTATKEEAIQNNNTSPSTVIVTPIPDQTHSQTVISFRRNSSDQHYKYAFA